MHHVEAWDLWVVSRYDDVFSVVRDSATFSSALGMGEFLREGIGPRRRRRLEVDLPSPGSGRLLIAVDPPDHTRLRKLVNHPFTPRAIAQREGRIRAICERLVDDLITENEAGDADLVTHLAYPLPVIVIAEMLGVPPERRDDFKRWSDDILAAVTATSGDQAILDERAMASGAALFGFFEEVVDERRRRPGDDIVSMIVAGETDGEDPLSLDELLLFAVLLLVAGNETTTNLLGNWTRAMFAHPGQLRRLTDDPSLVSASVEEALRYDSPVQGLFRGATRACELDGVRLPEGARVMVLFGSANRDERHYRDPDAYRIERNPSDHMAFGTGIHFCLGAHLARLEARVAIEALLRRTRNLRPAGEALPLDSMVLRGLERLPVAFDRA